MRYEGPIYRPPSEADSLLIQATVGCPHNKCTFCMVYKNGVKYKVRPIEEIKADLEEARQVYGDRVQTLFFPAGNTIAMPTAALTELCRHSYSIFPRLRRITVYGSSQFIYRKGIDQLRSLAEAGLKRIHVGLESGDDVILERIKKGSTAQQQIAAGQMLRAAGIEVSEYVMLGIGGKERTEAHARQTAAAINQIQPDFLRLRTFVPKINTPLLEDVLAGAFQMLGPHEVLLETMALIEGISVPTHVVSDHYTNYVNLTGRLPEDKDRLLATLRKALKLEESDFRPFFIGTQ
ncbi:MAG: radical SAM protein [Deltaproteobacteria bacterium]|nr:radical SAM protein [Deltaproteobacteria bacterium]MBW2134493.1 radical SAM protein [Deltaproteobacteria bacterium]